MDAALDMNGNAVTDLSALFFSSGNDGPAPGAAAFREACSCLLYTSDAADDA